MVASPYVESGAEMRHGVVAVVVAAAAAAAASKHVVVVVAAASKHDVAADFVVNTALVVDRVSRACRFEMTLRWTGSDSNCEHGLGADAAVY